MLRLPPFNSLAAMSSRVAASAVAVKAASGTPGKAAGSRASASYSGRNEGPQREMQCASSTAISASGRRCSAASMRSVISRSGEM
jgi:hypothetical protein